MTDEPMPDEPTASDRGSAGRERQARPMSLCEGREPVVLVPLDGSAEAKAALAAARLVAAAEGASVHAIHVSAESPPSGSLPRKMGLSREETHGLVLDHAFGAEDVVAETIARLAVERCAALIAMTTRGRTAYLGRTVRPVVERVLQEAPCPVLLVRPEIDARVRATAALRRVLLPLDGAPTSAAVIAPALDLAERYRAEADIVYVATEARPPDEPGTLTAPRYVDQRQYEWPAWGREFLDRFGTALGQHTASTRTRMFLRRGDPVSEILRMAEERASDLIVLEWRGRLDPDRARVVRGVLADAPCPVLLFRLRS